MFSKLKIRGFEQGRLTIAACWQEPILCKIQHRKIETLWKTSQFWGHFSDRTSEPSNIMKVLPFLFHAAKSLFSCHSPDAICSAIRIWCILFLFVNGQGDELMETLGWFVCGCCISVKRGASVEDSQMRWQGRKKSQDSISRSQRSWRLSLIQRYLLKTYLWRWELKDQSARFCHLNLTELTHAVSSGITTTSIRWWAKEESHSNVASVQSKRCKRTSSQLKLD